MNIDGAPSIAGLSYYPTLRDEMTVLKRNSNFQLLKNILATTAAPAAAIAARARHEPSSCFSIILGPKMGATEITVIHGNHKVVDLNPFKTLSSTIKALLWTQVYVVIGFLQKRVS